MYGIGGQVVVLQISITNKIRDSLGKQKAKETAHDNFGSHRIIYQLNK